MLGIIRWKEDTLLRYTVILIELRRSLFPISLVQAFYVLNILFFFLYFYCTVEFIFAFFRPGLLVFKKFFVHMFMQKSSIAVAVFNYYVKIFISTRNKCNKYDINEKMIL